MECFSLSLLSPTFILNPNLPHLSNSQSARSLTIKVRLEKGKNNRTCFYNGNSPFPSEEKQYWSWWTVTTVAPRGPPLLAVTPWYSSHPHLPLTLDLASEILAHMGWKQKLSKCLHIGAGLRRMNAWSSHPSARKRSSGKPCQQREGETGRAVTAPSHCSRLLTCEWSMLDIPSSATIWQQTHERLQVRSVEELPSWAPISPQNYGQMKWLLFRSAVFVI